MIIHLPHLSDTLKPLLAKTLRTQNTGAVGLPMMFDQHLDYNRPAWRLLLLTPDFHYVGKTTNPAFNWINNLLKNNDEDILIHGAALSLVHQAGLDKAKIIVWITPDWVMAQSYDPAPELLVGGFDPNDITAHQRLNNERTLMDLQATWPLHSALLRKEMSS